MIHPYPETIFVIALWSFDRLETQILIYSLYSTNIQSNRNSDEGIENALCFKRLLSSLMGQTCLHLSDVLCHVVKQCF